MDHSPPRAQVGPGGDKSRQPVQDTAVWAEQVRDTLTTLPPGARQAATVLYAAACADRLFGWYDASAAADKRAYSEAWRPVLADVWAHAAGDDTAFRRISDALGTYYLSEHSNNDGQDGPDDADQDEVAATYFAACAVIHGLIDIALWAMARATDHLELIIDDIDALADANEAERQQQQADLQVIVEAVRSGTLASDPAKAITPLRRHS